MSKYVEHEVQRAYSDVRNPGSDFSMARRELMFRASSSVDRDEAIRILNGIHYNDFKPEKLKHFPPNTKFDIAREYSVCLYLTNPDELDKVELNKAIKKAAPDENNRCCNDTQIRLWWD